MKKVRDLIMDSGCSENMISKFLMRALNLATDKHSRPYKVG